MYISEKFAAVSPSSTLAITAKFNEMKASGIDVVGFGAGEPDFETPQHIKDAAIKAMEAVDACVGKVMDKLVSVGGEAIIIADHGNCEQMIDLNTGEPITSHSTFDVPVIIVSDRVTEVTSGALTDVSPTLLDMMGLTKPKEMTGNSLVKIERK